jgi:hypothetical protein
MLKTPIVQDILSTIEPERERIAQDEQARHLQQEDRRRRQSMLYELLSAIKNCEPGTFDRKSQQWLTRETFYVALAARFIDLEKFLREEGLLPRLDRFPTDSMVPRFLRWFILECENNNAQTAGAVLGRLDGRDAFAAKLNYWLRNGLLEILVPEQWPPPKQTTGKDALEVSASPSYSAPRHDVGEWAEKEQWLPALQAVEMLLSKGFRITLADISKHKGELRTRPRTLRGRHKYEIEINSLAAWYVRRCKPVAAEPETAEEEGHDVLARRIAKAKAAKSKERSLD